MTSRYVLLMADLHTGGNTAIAPAGFVTSTGNPLTLNLYQEYLAECWHHQLNHLPDVVDMLCLAGDLVEGPNYKEEGRFVWERDPAWQAEAAIQLLRPISDRAATTVVASGTEYHVGRGASVEEDLAKDLKAVQDALGHFTCPWQNFMIKDVEFDIGHKQGLSKRNRATPLVNEINNYLKRIGHERKVRPAHVVIVRAHSHAGFRVVEREGITAISLPSWKIMDHYQQSSAEANAMVPENLGSVGLWVHDNGAVTIDKRFLYRHPTEPPRRLLD